MLARDHSIETMVDLIRADRDLDLEGRHTSVLADRAFRIYCQVDVLGNDRQGL